MHASHSAPPPFALSSPCAYSVLRVCATGDNLLDRIEFLALVDQLKDAGKVSVAAGTDLGTAFDRAASDGKLRPSDLAGILAAPPIGMAWTDALGEWAGVCGITPAPSDRRVGRIPTNIVTAAPLKLILTANATTTDLKAVAQATRDEIRSYLADLASVNTEAVSIDYYAKGVSDIAPLAPTSGPHMHPQDCKRAQS